LISQSNFPSITVSQNKAVIFAILLEFLQQNSNFSSRSAAFSLWVF